MEQTRYNWKNVKTTVEIASALLILAAWASVTPPPRLALAADPVALLAVLWIVLAASRNPRLPDRAVIATSVVLFLVYLWRQLPYALELLRQVL